MGNPENLHHDVPLGRGGVVRLAVFDDRSGRLTVRSFVRWRVRLHEWLMIVCLFQLDRLVRLIARCLIVRAIGRRLIEGFVRLPDWSMIVRLFQLDRRVWPFVHLFIRVIVRCPSKRLFFLF